MTRDIFISYKSEDAAAAQRICAGLERENISCWMAPRDIPAGTEWPAAIVAAIASSKTFLLILSSRSKNAKQISREAELADKHGARIVTLRIEEVQPPPELSYFLGNLQWLNAFDGQFDSAVACLAEMVRQPADAPSPVLSPPPAPHPTKPAHESLPRFAMPAGLALIALAAAFFFLRNGSSGKTSEEILQARAVADRFLNERSAGQFDAAWGEYTQAFRQRVDRQKWEADEALRRSHGQSGYKFNGCTPDTGGYLCDYTLLYNDGHPMDQKLSLVKKGDSWLIANGAITRH